MQKVNAFIAGCQKTGSTWLYRCFQEHPDIFVPEKDALHFFTINYFKGEEWYHQWFNKAGSEKIICDATPSYVRDPFSAERMFKYNPDAKVVIVLRNPVERSFSHYWHMRKKGLISYQFTDSLNYRGVGSIDLYQMWLRSSMYYHQLLPFYQLFPREQMMVVLFDDLKKDPARFLERIYDFLGVSQHKPTILDKKVNTSGQNIKLKKEKVFFGLFKKKIAAENEYEQGLDPEFARSLKMVFKEDIERVATLIGRDLSAWLQ